MLAGEAGDDTLEGGLEAALTTYFGHEGADVFVGNSDVNWIMDFEPGIDRLDLPMVDEQDVYLAWTTLGDLAGVDVLVCWSTLVAIPCAGSPTTRVRGWS